MKKWFWILSLVAGLVLGPVIPAGVTAAPVYQPEDIRSMKVALPDGVKAGYMLVGNGKWVIQPQFVEAYPFSRETGLAAVKIGEKYGFIDRKGQMVISPQFDKVGGYWNDGLMDVKVGDETGFINSTGDLVIGLQPGDVASFSEGLASVQIKDTTRFIDKTGTMVFEVKARCCGRYFRNGLVEVIPDGRSTATGFVDRTGKMVIEPQDGLFFGFNEGRASIRIGDKYGFIDTSGKVVIPAQYDMTLGFLEGLAPVLVDRKIGFIDLEGRMVLPAQYEYPNSNWQPQIALGNSLFHDGYAAVKWNGKFGVIDKSGKWVVKPIFNSAPFFYPQYKMVWFGGYYCDLNGKKLNHYANHMKDGEKALKNGDPVGAAEFYRAALKINPGDAAASWGLSQAEGQKK